MYLLPTNAESKQFQFTNPQSQYYGPFSMVNILVGQNNSGKSRFLRNLLTFPKYLLFTNNNWEAEIEDTIKFISENKVKVEKIYFNGAEYLKYIKTISQSEIELNSKLFSSLESIVIDKELTITTENLISALQRIDKIELGQEYEEAKNHLTRLIEQLNFLLSLNDEYINRLTMKGVIRIDSLPTFKRQLVHFEPFFGNLMARLARLRDIPKEIFVPTSKTYIPTLRTAISMFNGDQILRENQNTKTIFEQTILKNYGIRQNLVFTGNDLYHRIKQDRNNIKSVRVQFEKFEAFLSRAFFQNKQVELIAKESEKAEERHINVWIDGIERELHNVGDGIQSLITLMYPIFMAPEKSWIFIEEPETHLHPGLQRIFIEELISNEEFQKKELKVLLTTHSNHLIDQSFQNSHKISLFSCKRELREGIETVNVKQITTPQNQLLSDLGVKNSSVFLASCTLWIEGICDRIIIRKLIKLKSEQQNKILLEDIDFAFFEYAGSNLSHYLFSDNDSNNNLEELEEEDQKLINAFALSNNILLIADKDKGKLSKHLMYNEIERTGFSYYTLQVREIENSLSPGQLRQYLPKLFNRIPIDNWNSILENVKEDDYMDEYLGTFLKQKAEKSNLKIPKSLIAKSGTLETRYKTKLAQEFTNGHVTWNELSSSAKKLADRVYEYIIEAKK